MEYHTATNITNVAETYVFKWSQTNTHWASGAVAMIASMLSAKSALGTQFWIALLPLVMVPRPSCSPFSDIVSIETHLLGNVLILLSCGGSEHGLDTLFFVLRHGELPCDLC
jgi:hypothetical protein